MTDGLPASFSRPPPRRHPAAHAARLAKTVMRLPLAIVAALAPPAAVRAEGFVEGVSPPVVEVGKTTRVTFAGTQLADAVGVRHSLDHAQITAVPVESGPGRAVFDVTVQPTCPVGVCGVRVATRHGLSNAHLLLVDDLPVSARPAGDTAVSLPTDAGVWCTLREAAVDRYSLAAAAGQRVSVEVVGSRFG